MHKDRGQIYLQAMAIFWAVFGLITTFVPQLMELFMTDEGVAATSAFSDQVWLHGGLDILSVCLLLWFVSTRPTTPTGLRVAAVVALMPTAAIVWTLVTTPFWSPLFLVPAAGTVAFAVWGFWLSAAKPVAAPAPAG